MPSGRNTALSKEAIRARVLMTNRHMCCVCHGMPAMIHFIDGDPGNGRQTNLAAVCLAHYRRANLPRTDPGRLDPDTVRRCKSAWEKECLSKLLGLRGME